MKYKKTLLSTLLSSVLMCSFSGGAQAQALRPPTEKPNIIVIFLDDSGYADISANGGKIQTPNIDQMAKEGVNLTSFYVSSPVCSPSRAGLLTGRLETRTGVWGSQAPTFFEFNRHGLPKEEVTMAEMLRDNGYKTMMLGKWHLGIGKDKVEHIPTRHGFQEWYGIPTSNDMFFDDPVFTSKELMRRVIEKAPEDKIVEAFKYQAKFMADKDGWGITEKFSVPVYHSFSYADGSFKDEITGTMQQANYTQDLTQRAIDYIDQNRDQPFFMYLAYPQNHVPLAASEKFKGATDSAYGDVMIEIDDSTGRILNELKKVGIDKNTIVVFSSDNGPWLKYSHLGAAGSALPLRDGKSTTYEGGQRVFGVIKWTGQIKPNKTNGEMTSTLDLLPTFAHLTGAKLPNVPLDGFDLSNMLIKGQPSPRTVMPYYYMGHMQAYRSGDWKIHFMKAQAIGGVKLDKPELYNIKTDESETQNLADKSPDLVAKLTQDAKAYQASLGLVRPSLIDVGDELYEKD